MDDGETYMDGLIEGQNLAGDDDASQSSGEGEGLDEDDGQFSTITVDEEVERDISGRDRDRPVDEELSDAGSDAPEEGVEIIGMPSENENTATAAAGGANPTNLEDLPIPKNKSIAHHYYKEGKAVLCSFDLEHIGEYGGIVQISAVLGRVVMSDDGTINIVEETNTFTSYVQPPEGAIWNVRACATHQLNATMDCIQSADDICTVWSKFCIWINNLVDPSETVILVAYNGETCDLKWIWKLTQAPNAPCRMPPQIKFYIDPLNVMKEYRSCELHQSKSNLESYELGVVWKYLNNGNNLNGAHDSLVDAKAQLEIVSSDEFKTQLDRSQSVRHIDLIFKKKEQADMKRKLEPVRIIHKPWKEFKRDGTDNFSWEPAEDDQYTGAQGGGQYGPTSSVVTTAIKRTTTLATLFLLLFPMTLVMFIVQQTAKYAYKDWVEEKEQVDGNGKPKKRKLLVRCDKNTQGARRRAQRKDEQYDITPGFVLAFIAILIIQGGHFGENNRSRRMWEEEPLGLRIPYIVNSMPRNAFEFMRRYIKLSDDDASEAKPGHPRFHQLHKVKYVLDQMMNGIRNAWTAGREVCVDESMIKYKGRAVSWVQFMPAKPIKHGIKAFVAACARTAIILSYEIYLGASTTQDNTATAVIERLLGDADLLSSRGRVLYTDNWYTSMKLAKLMFEKYGWTICGTITPTDKKSREDEDVPFLKLSPGAVRDVRRGWYREAYIELKSPSGKTYYIQCTTWRDKKQCMFLHSHLVGASSNKTVARHVKGKKRKIDIDAPTSQIDYVDNYNAVDRQDRDSSDYTTSIKTIRYYIRIFCWMLDRVIHALYVIVCHLTSDGHRPDWKKYASKNNGRRRMQIELGILLLNHAIELDMKAGKPTYKKDGIFYTPWEDGEKPKWMRQTDPIPCRCKQCYFCINGITTGIAHPSKKRKVTIEAKNVIVKTSKCTTVRVKVVNNSQHCRMCYRKQDGALNSDGTKKSGKEKQDDCRTSTLGCAQCEEPICKSCWSEGYDRHQNESIEC